MKNLYRVPRTNLSWLLAAILSVVSLFLYWHKFASDNESSPLLFPLSWHSLLAAALLPTWHYWQFSIAVKHLSSAFLRRPEFGSPEHLFSLGSLSWHHCPICSSLPGVAILF